MTMTREQRERLPKAKLIHIRWSPSSGPYRDGDGNPRHRGKFASFRFANAAEVRIGALVVAWRMPWLERSARALHPEVFETWRAA